MSKVSNMLLSGQDLVVYEREKSEYDISYADWAKKKPFGFSGCFRLKNEEQFMRQSIETHLPYLNEACLIVQDSEDGTIGLAKRLKREYPDRVKVFYYPFNVHKIDTPGHFNLPENSVYTMMHLTNWALSRCSYSWTVKVEGDVLCMDTFAHIVKQVRRLPNEEIYYGRVGLNIAGENMDQFSFTNPRNAGWDEAVFPTHPKFHCVRMDKWESINMHARIYPLKCMGWSFIHTKRSKKGAKPGIERWEPLTKDNLSRALKKYNQKHGYPAKDNPLGIDELFNDWSVYK